MKTQKVYGIGFGGWLALIFITLKLCKVIAWSWWWVLAPLWVPVGIALAVAVGSLAVGALVCLLAWWLGRWRSPGRK